MIPLGKTHMVEFAFGGWGRNEPMGAPWNPWDLATHRVAGGSSSGSAVAVAAGTRAGRDRLRHRRLGAHSRRAVRHHGAEDDVRPRQPARRGAAVHAARHHRSARAHRRGLRAAHRGDGRARPARSRPRAARRVDSARSRRAPTCAACASRACRRAVSRASSSADVVRARDDAIAVLRDAGRAARRSARADRVRGHRGAPGQAPRRRSVCAAPRHMAENAALEIDPWVRKRILGGKAISAADFIDDMRAMRRGAVAFAAWMRDCDALLTPTLPITATPLAEVDESTAPLASFTRAVNYLGGCATVAARGLLERPGCRSACSSSARRSPKARSCASAARSSARPSGIGAVRRCRR